MKGDGVFSREDLAKLSVLYECFSDMDPALPLHEEPNRFYMDEDMLQGVLPNGKVLDVGWYPSLNPDGSFRVCVNESSQADWNPDFEGECRKLEELREIVHRTISKNS